MRVTRVFDQINEWLGKPARLLCETKAGETTMGQNTLVKPLLEWATKRHITMFLTQSGNLQQNAYVERYNRTVRCDWLTHNLFVSLEDILNGMTPWL